MIFFTLILIIFKSFIFLIEFVFRNNIFALEIWFCWFIWIAVLINKLKSIQIGKPPYKKINLNIYKLHQPNLRIIFVLLYLTCFIITLFLLKVYKSFSEVSLKQLYGELINFFSPLNFGQQLYTILFGLTLIYLAIRVTKKLKNFIFKELIKVHLYLGANQIYLDYILQPMLLNSYIRLIGVLVVFFRSKVTFLNKVWFSMLLRFLIENLVLILILSLVCFDIWFNDYVLTKIFYILPLCFLYSQWLYMSKFYMSKNILIDNWIHKYLYTKIFFEDENIIIFADGNTVDIETRLEIDQYIEKGFRTFFNKKKKDS